MRSTKLVTRYLHNDNEELSDLWKPEDHQQEMYRYSLYEVKIDLEVDLDTGESRICAVDGIDLAVLGDFQ
jgi:hypothetical protein